MLKAITAWLVIFLGMGVGGVLGGRATSTFSQPDPHHTPTPLILKWVPPDRVNHDPLKRFEILGVVVKGWTTK